MGIHLKLLVTLFWCFLGFSSSTCAAKVVFVSSSRGDDSNRGITQDAPLKTIDRALRMADTVLLKSGDSFYESVVIKHGLLSKYGEGRLPVITGYKRIVEPHWEIVGNNIWKISLTGQFFSGFITQGSTLLNNIGCIHEYDKDLLHGRKVQNKAELKEDWDIWQTEHHTNYDVLNSDFDNLYLYLKEDPNTLQLEFSVSSTAISISNATIDNIRVEGFGFGVSAGTRSVIRNCEIDAIGGKTQITSAEFVCFGNGIEFWIVRGLSDCIAENNIISRCYDSGCTIQGRIDSPKNIRIRNNLIINCCQGWEDFLTNSDPNVVFIDCVFENNIVLNSGRTSGFGYPKSRFKFCHVLGNNIKGNKGMIIRNNTFVGGNFYCSGAFQGKYISNVWEGNTCVIKRGDYLLSNYTGTRDVIRVPKEKGVFGSLHAADEEAIRHYRELTADMTTKFLIMSERRINSKINKYKRKRFVK